MHWQWHGGKSKDKGAADGSNDGNGNDGKMNGNGNGDKSESKGGPDGGNDGIQGAQLQKVFLPPGTDFLRRNFSNIEEEFS